jgi:DNA invertase Pin-like site-specific DNA recombinase
MRAGRFDVLLVHALDRLSGTRTTRGWCSRRRSTPGCCGTRATEEIDDSPTGKILRAVIGGMAELERLKIAERTVRGRIARVQSGKLIPGGRPPYGYRWRDETKGNSTKI